MVKLFKRKMEMELSKVLDSINIKAVLVMTIFLLITSCKNEIRQGYVLKTDQMDSISSWVIYSKDASLLIKERKDYLNKAFNLSLDIKSDSLKTKALLKVAYAAYKLGDSSFFKIVNRRVLEICIKAKDTFGIADIEWNYGAFFIDRMILDSAYFHYHKAYENFQSINHEFYSGKMLYSMAIIQKDIKDYTGSEIHSFQAIQKFEELNKPINLYLCYNLLGVIFNEIEEFKKAIFYHEKAMDYLGDVDDKATYKEGSFNNLGLVYQRQKKYNESIYYFERALKNKNLINLNINLYARLLDNLAYSRLLRKDSADLYPIFYRALTIRDSLNNNFGVSISRFHLSKYYLSKRDTTRAIVSALESYRLATDVKNNKGVLKSLKLLSQIDQANSVEYLERYINLNDILQNREKRQRNKFTRIRFETNKYIRETQRLDSERKIIVVVSFAVILITSLLFLIKIQRSKNKELQFEKKQQKANEEIYSLMLRQQIRLEEGKISERNRIAEDLHDGVLSRIFGTRMGLGFLRLVGDENVLKKHKAFIEELQKIETEIRDISHELKTEGFSAEYNFVILVEDLLESQSKIGLFDYTLECDENIEWNSIIENVKINCYRILQEAVYNVNKHAKATKLSVIFRLEENKLHLLVKDNGLGFELGKKRKGIGLKNIKMRAKNINAKFILKSALSKGTSLEFKIPV